MPHSRVTWVSDVNFHVTLHFLGDTELKTKDKLIVRLSGLEYPDPFELKLKAVMAFPDKKRPKTIFIETTTHPSVYGLHKRTGKILAELGLPLDERPWQPHVTLGRVRTQSEVLQPEKITVEPLSFLVDKFFLMKSTLTSDGSLYETLAGFEL